MSGFTLLKSVTSPLARTPRAVAMFTGSPERGNVNGSAFPNELG
jgi:hypothetical protein